MDLSIVLPAWNEAENLRALVPALREALDGHVPTYEIVVVDGGSKDGTADVARALGCTAFQQKTPGYGGALREGFQAAQGRFIATLDADLSHPPTFLREMWARREEAELVVASRYVSGGSAEMPKLREVLSIVLNRTFGELLAIPVKDLSSGFRLYRREALAAFETKGTNFNVLQELLTGVLARGGRVIEVPFRYMPRIHGVSHARIIRFGISYLGSLWHLFFVRTALFTGREAARTLPYLLVILLALGLAYVNALSAGTVRWDDDYLVFENPALRSLDAASLGAMFDPTGSRATYGSQYQPLSDLSYALDGAIFGWKDARPFHVQGILWHGLAACALFLLANRHARSAGLALTAALLFALHPLATESVTWISGRRTAMQAALTLLAALSWLRFRQGGGALAYAGSLGALVGACLAKQGGVMTPLVLLALDLTLPPPREGTLGAAPATPGASASTERPTGPGPAGARLSSGQRLHLLPHLALGAVFAAVAIAVGRREGIVGGLGAMDPGTRLEAAALALGTYARLIVWPADLRPVHSLILSEGARNALLAAAAGAVLAILLGLAMALRRGARTALFALLAALATLAPALGIVGTQIVAERHLYAPLAFLALLFGMAILAAARPGPPPATLEEEVRVVRRRRAVTALLLGLCLALGAATHVRNRAWASDIALWEDAAAKDPASGIARRLLGEALMARAKGDDLVRAEGELEAATRLELANPVRSGPSPLPLILGELAILRERRGDVAGAERALTEAVARTPDSERAHIFLAEHLRRHGQPDRARALLLRFLERHPGAKVAREMVER